jgi:hypothetical protein
MAVLTSMPGEGNSVNVFDVPDDVLQQYAVTGEQAAKMFPEGTTPTGGGIAKSDPAASPAKLENAESLGEVQAYNAICVCRQLFCNHWRCWWHYYYCYC